MVLGVVVECPVALGANLEAGPRPILLRREYDRDCNKPSGCIVAYKPL
jgi:hypothetical protein